MDDVEIGEIGSHAGPTRSSTVVVILAAGAGSRFHDPRHKLSVLLPESSDEPPATVLDRAIGHALAAAVGPVIVVTGADRGVLTDAHRHAVVERHNPNWDDGQITSLHVGLAEARARGADAVVVGLGDQPFIDPSAWRAVAASDAAIAVATYDGRRGNPVRLDHTVWDLLARRGDEGARGLMRVRPDLVTEVPCSGSPADIDTTEDLRRWQNN